MVAESGIKTVTGGGGDGVVKEVSGAEMNRRAMKAPIFKHWSTPILLSTEERPHPSKTVDDGNGGQTQVMVPHYQWQFTCQELTPLEKRGDGKMLCLHERIEWNGSNGNRFKYFEGQHKDLHAKLTAQSKHSSKQNVNGVPTKMLTWSERFPHLAMYTVETYLITHPSLAAASQATTAQCLRSNRATCCHAPKHSIR